MRKSQLNQQDLEVLEYLVKKGYAYWQIGRFFSLSAQSIYLIHKKNKPSSSQKSWWHWK
jgi:hypothetical protein